MTRLAVLGSGGHGRVVADIAISAGWDSVEFFDDAFVSTGQSGPWRVVGGSAELAESFAEYDGVIVAIGNADARSRRVRALEDVGAKLVTIVHPKATVSSFVELGAGCVVMAGAVLNVGTKIGRGVIINTGATVDHDCSLEDFVHVCPGAHLAGGVRVGSHSWIGIGAVVRQEINIGCGVLVGAGAVVVDDIRDGLTVVGCPAKEIYK